MRSLPLPRRSGPRALRAHRTAAALATAVLLLSGAPAVAAAEGAPDRDFTIKDPRITESSGLAASRIHPGVYWTHNDSAHPPYIYAVDSRTGETVATVTLEGIGDIRDAEAISLGPDGNLYVGDIGDNLDGSWDHVWIYRFPEPEQLKDVTVRPTQFTVRYADGPRDAESMMVHPKTGRVYIASKNRSGGGLYEGPEKLTASGTNTFRRIGEVPWVTDGAFSPDGEELTFRSYFSARTYAWKDGGRLGGHRAVSAPLQRQAESVTYTADGRALMFGTEGAHSGVVRVDIAKGTGSGSGADDGAAGKGSGGAASSGGTGDGSGGRGNATLGAFVLAAAAALFFGFRRLRGRTKG
ncbi:SdiA-regulated/phytase-like domain-containing protein [Streptomyces corynorhini]|uniref:WD40 repeat domain-containing protein n=1 Tax=Streptomyces corynorhini TaxID=2282652 RepID=A0A370BFJ5_9ACTN|nr:WD40 repeat domain-containing protein [Streptomyces corynorhini]RDG39034.1 WD40 repeat domain-containing protein [Streptomyces corynorhini]